MHAIHELLIQGAVLVIPYLFSVALVNHEPIQVVVVILFVLIFRISVDVLLHVVVVFVVRAQTRFLLEERTGKCPLLLLFLGFLLGGL